MQSPFFRPLIGTLLGALGTCLVGVSVAADDDLAPWEDEQERTRERIAALPEAQATSVSQVGLGVRFRYS